MENTDSALIISLISRLMNDIAMNKAFSQVILTEISKQQGSSKEELILEVGKLHAQYVLDSEKIFDQIVRDVLRGESDLPIEDLLKTIRGK